MAELGWSVTVVWECEIRDMTTLAGRLTRFLGPPPHTERRAANTTLPP